MKTVRKTRNTRSSTTLKLKEGEKFSKKSPAVSGWSDVRCDVLLINGTSGWCQQGRGSSCSVILQVVAGTQAMPQVTGAVAPGTLPTLKSYITALCRWANAVKHSFWTPQHYIRLYSNLSAAATAVRSLALTAPNIPVVAGGYGCRRWEQNLIAPLSPDKSDQIGNAMACGTGTILMARVTLEQLARFPSLDAFFSKDATNLAGTAHRPNQA
jgi:hypothetical protein